VGNAHPTDKRHSVVINIIILIISILFVTSCYIFSAVFVSAHGPNPDIEKRMGKCDRPMRRE